MSRRVSKTAAVVVLALSLSLQAPAAFAATRDRGDGGPGFVARVIRVIKQVVKGLTPTVLDDTNLWPMPPKP